MISPFIGPEGGNSINSHSKSGDRNGSSSLRERTLHKLATLTTIGVGNEDGNGNHTVTWHGM